MKVTNTFEFSINRSDGRIPKRRLKFLRNKLSELLDFQIALNQESGLIDIQKSLSVIQSKPNVIDVSLAISCESSFWSFLKVIFYWELFRKSYFSLLSVSEYFFAVLSLEAVNKSFIRFGNRNETISVSLHSKQFDFATLSPPDINSRKPDAFLNNENDVVVDAPEYKINKKLPLLDFGDSVSVKPKLLVDLFQLSVKEWRLLEKYLLPDEFLILLKKLSLQHADKTQLMIRNVFEEDQLSDFLKRVQQCEMPSRAQFILVETKTVKLLVGLFDNHQTLTRQVETTPHCRARQQERVISNELLELVIQFGRAEAAKRDAVKYVVDGKALKSIRDALSAEDFARLSKKLVGLVVVVENNQVLTTFQNDALRRELNKKMKRRLTGFADLKTELSQDTLCN